MKKVAALLLFFGWVSGSFCQAQVTVQKQRSRPPQVEKPANRRTKPADAEQKAANRRAERAFRRIQGDEEPDYARPTKLIEMSIRAAPSLSFHSADGLGSYQGFAARGPGIRMSVGPSLDYYFFKDRYAFSSGLWYTIKRSAYEIPGQFGQDRWTPGAPRQQSTYNLQYAQIPLSVKMFANNLIPTARLYIQCGGLLNIKLAEKALDEPRNALYRYATRDGDYRRQYGRGDVSLLLGTGVQYRLNRDQAIILGVSYQRGLLDIARARELESRMNIVALEVGLKF